MKFGKCSTMYYCKIKITEIFNIKPDNKTKIKMFAAPAYKYFEMTRTR